MWSVMTSALKDKVLEWIGRRRGAEVKGSEAHSVIARLQGDLSLGLQVGRRKADFAVWT